MMQQSSLAMLLNKYGALLMKLKKTGVCREFSNSSAEAFLLGVCSFADEISIKRFMLSFNTFGSMFALLSMTIVPLLSSIFLLAMSLLHQVRLIPPRLSTSLSCITSLSPVRLFGSNPLLAIEWNSSSIHLRIKVIRLL